MKRKMHGNGLFTQVSVINWRMIQMSGATPHINQSSASKKENFSRKSRHFTCVNRFCLGNARYSLDHGSREDQKKTYIDNQQRFSPQF